MNTKTRDPSVSTDGDDALLAAYGLAELPVTFAMRDGSNGIVQTSDACYECKADGFYGRGRTGTWYQEGSIIIIDVVPNEHMQPLNRAAGIRYAKWAASLPNNQAPIDVGDMSEAAHILAKDPRSMELDSVLWQEAVVRTAVAIKLKREGKTARDLPSIGHNFAPQSGGSSPPILGAKLSDMAQRGPGGQIAAADPAQIAQGGVRTARAAPSALGGATPPR